MSLMYNMTVLLIRNSSDFKLFSLHSLYQKMYVTVE
jgi:hypothetical protein